MSDTERERQSRIIADRFLRSPWFLSASNIGIYLPADDEVDTKEIISRAWRAQKNIFVPIIDRHYRMNFSPLRPDTQLRKNHYGLFEPVTTEYISARQLQVVVCPLVAFDDDGNRIGMGGGFFDRSFAFLRQRRSYLQPKLIGVAFACQRVEKIPANPWDTPLFACISSD